MGNDADLKAAAISMAAMGGLVAVRSE